MNVQPVQQIVGLELSVLTKTEALHVNAELDLRRLVTTAQVRKTLIRKCMLVVNLFVPAVSMCSFTSSIGGLLNASQKLT